MIFLSKQLGDVDFEKRADLCGITSIHYNITGNDTKTINFLECIRTQEEYKYH